MAGRFDDMKTDSVKAFLAGDSIASVAPGSPAGTREKLDEYAATCTADPVACADGIENGLAARKERQASYARFLKGENPLPIGPAEKAEMTAIDSLLDRKAQPIKHHPASMIDPVGQALANRLAGHNL